MEDAVLECGGADLGVEPAADKRIGTRTIDDYETHCPVGKSSPWTTNVDGNEPCTTQRNTMGELHVGQPVWFGRRGANAAKKPTNAFCHPGVVVSNTLTTVWMACRGSVVMCARSQVPPFHDDDEAAHEHVTEHMRDLGERLLHEGDFSYEDITGQDEPPVGSPPAPGENTVTGPEGERQMDVDPEDWKRVKEKNRTVCPEQSTSALINTNSDAAPREA